MKASREEKDLFNSHVISKERQYIFYYGKLRTSSYGGVKKIRNMYFWHKKTITSVITE